MASTKPNGRKRVGRFAGIPHIVMDSPNYCKLNGWDVRLLLDLAKQYNGSNNGDLSATWSMMKSRGWRSPSTLSKSTKQLIAYGFIALSRQGGRHKCNLFSLTWAPIDDCKGKLDVAETKQPSNAWKIPIKPPPKI